MKLTEKRCSEKGPESKLSENQIQRLLSEIPSWSIKDNLLYKKYEFPNFKRALDFVNKVGDIAEKENHHPDICFGWGYAKINLTTHSVGGLSENDFILAAKIEKG